MLNVCPGYSGGELTFQQETDCKQKAQKGWSRWGGGNRLGEALEWAGDGAGRAAGGGMASPQHVPGPHESCHWNHGQEGQPPCEVGLPCFSGEAGGSERPPADEHTAGSGRVKI